MSDTQPSSEQRRASPIPFLVVGVVLVACGILLALLAPLRTDVSCSRDGASITCRVSEENRLGTRDHGAATSDDWATEGSPATGLILRAGPQALRLPFEPEAAERFASGFTQFKDSDAPSFTFAYDEPEGAAVIFGLTTLIGLILLGIGALMKTAPTAFARRSKKAKTEAKG